MTGLQLLALLDLVLLLALSGLLGAILFFSFGVAPVIFRVLPAEHAARFVRALFPRYYTWNAACAAIALPSVVCGPLAVPELRGPLVALQAGTMVLVVLAMLYCGNALTPAINAARDAGPSQAGRFEGLHRRSLRLNGLALFGALIVLGLHVARPTPRTDGLVDPVPAPVPVAPAAAPAA